MMTIFNEVKKDFLKLAAIPENEWNEFVSLFNPRSIKKNEYFVHSGQYSTEFGFVEKGLVRFFYTTYEGAEFNQTFKKEGDLMMSFTSILLNEPSNFSIQALEDSIIYVTDYKIFQHFYQKNPAWQELGRKIAEINFIIKTKKEEQFLLFNAQQRYENFRRDFPELARRVPQMHLASYLGVSSETLNRIIKKARD
jgi:CRP-like cAMP-binding protein